MKLGFCLLSWLDTPEETDPKWFADLRRIGYDGVEVPVVRGEADDFRRLAQLLEAAGLDRVAHTLMPPGRDPISEYERERKAAFDHVEWALHIGHDMGAKLLVGPIHHTLGVFTGSGASPAELSRLTTFYRHAGDIAASLDMKIAIEPMNRFETHVFNRLDDLAAHLDEVNHPNVVALYDTFHANIEESDPVAALARNIRHVGHMHVAENDRGTPGTGHVPWRAIFSVLKKSAYDGWLSVETFSRAVPAIAAGARVWREPRESREERCQRSYTFVRDEWEAA